MFLISDLCHMLDSYLEEDQVKEVYRAYVFGADAHEGQLRRSGEPYIYHPLAVARILAELRMDYKTLMAAILHDVIEDTATAKEQLINEFDEEVADLVDGVSKLTQITFESRAEAQAENFRKLILAMVQDIRVILIKLADRLHNMRTIGNLQPEKQRRIAKETLDIYVPIASRLGMNNIKIELEDLGFKAVHPMRYEVLQASLLKARGNRKEIIHKIITAIDERIFQEGLHGRVSGREKLLYSIYQKMRKKNLSFAEVFDVYAVRISVETVDMCYRTLGVLHNLYKPLPGKFKDYIAIPKTNGYQSLHTVLFGPHGIPIEVQVRTNDMNKVAEAGIAAHWMYKNTNDAISHENSQTNEWLRELLEIQKSSGNSIEFLESVKVDLFPDVVYVFTPAGEIMELQRGSTPVDFAYAVHTDIGNTCIAAKIDRQLVPLRTQMQMGQTVEIITANSAKPNPAWLNFVITGKARTHIRHFLKNLQRGEAIVLGKRLLDRNLTPYRLSTDTLNPENIDRVLETLRLKNIDDLLSEIGLGNRMPLIVARQLAEPSIARNKNNRKKSQKAAALKNMLYRYAPSWLGGEKTSTPLAITGTEGIIVNYARCCRPIPGDPVIGYFSAGKGIVVHVDTCTNVRDVKKHPENWLELRWEKEPQREFPVEIRLEVTNQRGVLATVASAISEMSANIENVSLDDRDGRITDLIFVINVKDRKHLAKIMRRVRRVDEVSKIYRQKA